MSRSAKRRSVPNGRGRRQEMLTKRASSKRVRRMQIESSFVLLKRERNKTMLDRETNQSM